MVINVILAHTLPIIHGHGNPDDIPYGNRVIGGILIFIIIYWLANVMHEWINSKNK